MHHLEINFKCTKDQLNKIRTFYSLNGAPYYLVKILNPSVIFNYFNFLTENVKVKLFIF